MRKIIGYSLLASPFVALGVAICVVSGPVAALVVFGGVSVLVSPILVGTYLISTQ